MKLPVILFGFLSLFAANAIPAADIAVDETSDDEGELHKRVFRFSAKPGPEEVLVVHGTRWENGVKVLEIEEVCSGVDACTIKVSELAPDYWHLAERTAEQHVQGVKLARCERSVAGLELELVPAPGGARRSYAFRWNATVENWSEVKRRHPALATDRPSRMLVFPVLPAAGR